MSQFHPLPSLGGHLDALAAPGPPPAPGEQLHEFLEPLEPRRGRAHAAAERVRARLSARGGGRSAAAVTNGAAGP